MIELSKIFPNVPVDIDLAQLDINRIPQHVAIIMDGNGRWAKQRGKKRLFGHKAGVKSVKEVVRCASDIGVKYLTIYSFSTENWMRPHEEVIGLMDLFAKSVLAEMEELHENNVKIQIIGDTSILPKKTQSAFDKATEMMKNNTGMMLLPAVNYGSRKEILRAVQAYAEDYHVAKNTDNAKNSEDAQSAQGAQEIQGVQDERAGKACANSEDNLADLSEEKFSKYLYTADVPDPELLIRTSGEMRISNFLLWQIAYSEFYVTDTLWPDFDRYEFLRALIAFQRRDRRFGGVKA